MMGEKRTVALPIAEAHLVISANLSLGNGE